MSFSLAVSHIYVISEDLNIVDLGEYSQNRLHVSNGEGKHAMTLQIVYPPTKTKIILTTLEDKTPITDICSYTNKNSDCIIFGTVRDISPPIGSSESSLIIIDPYTADRASDRISKEADVQSKLLARNFENFVNRNSTPEERITKRMKRLRKRVQETEPKQTARKNPIVERMKQVQL